MERVVRAWNGFWFAEGDVSALAIFRIGWALTALVVLQSDASHWALYKPEHFHLPLLAWAEPVSEIAFSNAILAAKWASLFVLLGVFSPLGIVVVVAIEGYIMISDVLVFRNHVYLTCLLGLPLVFAPADRALSLGRLVNRRLGRAPATTVGSLCTAQMIKVQILLVYGWACLNKFRLGFLNGSVLQAELLEGVPRSFVGALMERAPTLNTAVLAALDSRASMAALSCIAIALEGTACVCLPWPKYRRYGVAAGIALHSTILLTMNVVAFGLLMVASYPLFFQKGHRAASAPT